MGRLAAGLVAATALAVPAAASAATADVNIQQSAFAPSQIAVLTGDTVAWQNQSYRNHTVTARDGSFGSDGPISPNKGYSFQFTTLGAHPYICLIHTFMSGEVDVYPALLSGPTQPVGRGGTIPLDGRAAPGTGTVEIDRDTGSGFSPVATVAANADGTFHADVPATSTAKYQAVVAAGPSQAVQVVVINRKLSVSAVRRKRYAVVRVTASPRDPGGSVSLQLYLRERFGWWTVARHRLDGTSRATFRAPFGVRARVVLTLPDGWTPVTASKTLRLPKRR